jgi:hypothetical protein
MKISLVLFMRELPRMAGSRFAQAWGPSTVLPFASRKATSLRMTLEKSGGQECPPHPKTT